MSMDAYFDHSTPSEHDSDSDKNDFALSVFKTNESDGSRNTKDTMKNYRTHNTSSLMFKIKKPIVRNRNTNNTYSDYSKVISFNGPSKSKR